MVTIDTAAKRNTKYTVRGEKGENKIKKLND